MATKTTAKAKVGSGIPGISNSKGSTQRIWKGGEFLLELNEVSAKDKVNDDGDITGQNVRIQTTCLGGPVQDDDTSPKGEKINLFVNVNYALPFTIDQLADLFLAAGVKITSDEPPYGKLSGKKVVGKLGERVGKDAVPRQSAYFINPSKSKAFGSAAGDN
jgi:hypothetical protein